MKQPWHDWIPGVLNKNQMKKLAAAQFIRVPSPIEDRLDESSLDLTLSHDAFEMVHGSVKPDSRIPYCSFLKNTALAKSLDPEKDGSFHLQGKQTYIFKLNEKLQKKLGEIGIYGQATAKSSVGRVDVLARLIVDGMNTYEGFNPAGLCAQSGDMYLEVTPITFDVKVSPEKPLSQLRFFYGDPSHVEIKSPQLYRTIFHEAQQSDGSLTEGSLAVSNAAAFCAEAPRNNEPIPLWETEPKPDPCKYWELIKSEAGRLTIEANKCYILRSKQTISVPPGIAIYCRASDETIGEMRIHYAGFVHPRFGFGRDDGAKGTPLIFEVRGHQVQVSLAHGERMANLMFYRMSQDATEDANGCVSATGYDKQTLQLSKFFADWPERLESTSDDGP